MTLELVYSSLDEFLAQTKKPILIGHSFLPEIKSVYNQLKQNGYRGQLHYTKTQQVEKRQQQLLIEFVNQYRGLPAYNTELLVDSKLKAPNQEGYLYLVIGRRYNKREPDSKPKEIQMSQTTVSKKVNTRRESRKQEQREWELSQEGKSFIDRHGTTHCFL
jgi:hypothetical protein